MDPPSTSTGTGSGGASCGGHKREFSTKRVERTACPTWNERFSCDFDQVDREVLFLELRDGHSNAVLGSTYIPLLGLFRDKRQMMTEQGLHKWFCRFFLPFQYPPSFILDLNCVTSAYSPLLTSTPLWQVRPLFLRRRLHQPRCGHDRAPLPV